MTGTALRNSDEYLYHVNEEDVVLGQVTRESAHTTGTLHRAGVIFLVRSDDRILLQYRSPAKETFPDRYDASSSFHVSFGESYLEAAERELREELGVSAPLASLGKFTHHDHPEHQIVAVFSCRCDEPVRIDPSEASHADFYSRSEIDRIAASMNATPWLRFGWMLARNML